MAQQKVDGSKVRQLRLAARPKLKPMHRFVAALEAKSGRRWNEATLYNIELGNTQPSDDLLDAMCLVFQCDATALQPDDEPATTQDDRRPAAGRGCGPS